MFAFSVARSQVALRNWVEPQGVLRTSVNEVLSDLWEPKATVTGILEDMTPPLLLLNLKKSIWGHLLVQEQQCKISPGSLVNKGKHKVCSGG